MTDRSLESTTGEYARPSLSSEQWVRVQAILALAIESDPSSLRGLLDRECEGDEALRREVESLLDAHGQIGPVDRLSDDLAPVIARTRQHTSNWSGTTIGQYTILEALGAGGMGVVHKARDTRLGRQVALKFLSAHLVAKPHAKKRFLLEARAAAALDHPNVCTIHEIGETPDGQLFIAMPLYDGETLHATLSRGPLSLEAAVDVVLKIANGLQHAHDHRVIHRDVKPSNVMLLPGGGVKVLDFGVAKMQDVTLTDVEEVPGTIAYMSPEHAQGQMVDGRTDVWSVGVVLYELLAGTRPFRGEHRHELMVSILTQEPDPVTTWRVDLPAEVDEVLRKALAKSPEGRFESMSAMATAVAALTAREGTAIRSPTFSPARTTSVGDTFASVERRWAAVLVSVISDHGTLVEQLAPDDFHHVISEIRARVTQIVRRHGGVVNQAVDDQIVSLFGVPITHEDDDLRAVRAAMELSRAASGSIGLAEHTLGRAVRIQSGVHVGLLVAQRAADSSRRYAISGSPVQVATRLAAIAGAETVLISPDCLQLVAPFVEAEPSLPLTIEAGAAQVTPFRVRGESGLETRLEASERSGLTPYTGRETELATLESQLAQAGRGQGRTVLVVGEAGVGKSRLLYEFHERVRDARVTLLQGRCRPHRRITPYAAFVDILLDALGASVPMPSELQADEIAARLRVIDPTLESFTPLYLHLLSIQSDSFQLPRHLQGEQLRVALVEALTAVVLALARRQTTLVLLEDWHWADDASRGVLRRLMELVAVYSLLMVVTSRPEPGALAECTEEATRMPLAALDRDGSTAIMRALLRVKRVSDELALGLHERTGGNPFFLEQVCHALLEEGLMATDDGEAAVTGGVEALRLPNTVQAVIRTRLDRLDRDARDVLRVASVIGREFGRAVLTEALGENADPSDALERLGVAGLIQQTRVLPEPIYRFRHVLTQEATYESLVGHQRRSLHEVIGRAIERRLSSRSDDVAYVLAHHFSQAEVWLEAIQYGMRAADRSSALSQFGDALSTLERVHSWVMRLPENEARDDRLADVLLQQERLSETLGFRARQRQIIEALVALLAPKGASARLAHAYLRQGDVATLLTRFDEAERALTTARRMSRELGEISLERQTLRSIGLLRWHQGRYADGLAIAESALVIDRESKDDLAVAGDLANIGIIYRSMGEYQRALASFEEALTIPALGQHPAKLLYALHGLANTHRSLGDLDRALACLHRANEIADTHALPIQRSFHLMSIAHVYLQQGRVDDAVRTYEDSARLSRRAQHAEGLSQALRALGEVLVGLGKDQEALEPLEEAAQLFAQLEDQDGEADMWVQVARTHERRGSMKQAAEVWERGRSLRQGIGDRPGELKALEGKARALRASSPSLATSAFQDALALATTLGDRRTEAALLNTLGILAWEQARFGESLRYYERALQLMRELGDRVHEPLMLNSLGVVLGQLKRYEEARTVLEESVTLSRESGELQLEAHALAALGDVCRASGRLSAALEWFEQSRALRPQLGDRKGEGWVLHRLAETRAAMNDDSGAQDALAAATAIAAECDDPELASACERTRDVMKQSSME